jgi:pyruvate dehydrogenase E1 component
MLEQNQDEFYYLTVMNENYAQPSMPPDAYDDIVRGMHRLHAWTSETPAKRVRLLGSGAILLEVLAAADLLREEWGVDAEVWSVTSFSELARDARAVERWNRLHPGENARVSHLETCLAGDAVTVAATDYVRAYPGLIAPYVQGDFLALGTDGFGRSATRAELRRFFEVDRRAIAIAALARLAKRGAVPASEVSRAVATYEPDSESAPPWER